MCGLSWSSAKYSRWGFFLLAPSVLRYLRYNIIWTEKNKDDFKGIQTEIELKSPGLNKLPCVSTEQHKLV